MVERAQRRRFTAFALVVAFAALASSTMVARSYAAQRPQRVRIEVAPETCEGSWVRVGGRIWVGHSDPSWPRSTTIEGYLYRHDDSHAQVVADMGGTVWFIRAPKGVAVVHASPG